jgi:hypothetical protein
MKIKSEPSKPLACSLCGQSQLRVTQCDGGYVCEACAEQSRHGRDNTSRAVKTLQRSIRGQARKKRIQLNDGAVDVQLDFDIAASEMLAAEAFQHCSVVAMVTGGEVLPQHDMKLIDTLAAPGATALDASANRLDLITSLGADVAAMALDASETMGATNSLEKMLAHQLAVCHDGAMRFSAKASLEQDPLHMVRLMNLANRSMETFQKGLLTLKRLRSSGEQRIMVQHVDVRDGGQAVISQMIPGSDGPK